MIRICSCISFYNARYYDPELARFTQADTIVPEPGNPQTFNRFSYVKNNPLKYIDPTGHEGCAANDDACWEAEWKAKDRWFRARGYRYNERNKGWSSRGPAEVDNADVARELLAEAGITTQGQWTDAQLIEVVTGVGDLSRAVGGVGRLNELIGGYATFYHPSEPIPWYLFNCLDGIACALPPPLMDGHSVYFKTTESLSRRTTVHELAHIIDWNSSIDVTFSYYGATLKRTTSFSSAWQIYTTDYSMCPLNADRTSCVSTWERWADAVTTFVYPGVSDDRLDSSGINIMRRLLLGWGWP